MMWQGSSYEPWIHTTEEKSGNRGSEGLMADSVKVTNHFWSLLIKLHNFTFVLKAVLCLENTILDSRLASLLAWRSRKYNHPIPQLELKLGPGLSLEI